MYPIPIHDVLEVIADGSLDEGKVTYTRSGIAIPGDPSKDLCVLAIEEFRKFFPLPGLKVHLHKVIPIGAGLGGGSSDGAHMLSMLSRLFWKELEKELPEMASLLGSDCPFFLRPKAQLAEGRGELLTELNVPHLVGKWMMLVNPGIHVPTAAVYSAMRPTGRSVVLMEIITLPIDQWQGRLVNDMEEYVLSQYASIGSVKQQLLKAGAIYASMSGSGSSVFGIFDHEPASIQWPEDHLIHVFQLP